MTINGKPKFDFKDLVDHAVYTSENDYLGKITSINYDQIKVKSTGTDQITYEFPFSLFNKWDGHSVWLRLTFEESVQYIINSTSGPNLNIHPKTEYETVTFRLNENVMSMIRSQAFNRSISLNSFANYILARYIKDKFETDAGTACINKPVLTEIFKKKTKDELIQLAKDTAKDAIYNRILFSKGEVTTNSVIHWIKEEMLRYSFSFKHLNSTNKDVYIIWHNMSYNFSLYYKCIIEGIFSEYLSKFVNVTISDEIILFEMENQK